MSALKAYEVRVDSDEGNCVVVFEERSVVARRRGANQLDCDFDEVASCIRAPHFDQYAPGPVPLLASLAAGWCYSCAGCGCEFDNEGLRGIEGDQPEIDPIEDRKGSPYCSQACMMASWQERRELKAREHAAIDLALSKWPSALKVWPLKRHSGGDGFAPDTCDVLLPGLQGSIRWQIGATTVGVDKRDLEAYFTHYGQKQANPLRIG